LIHVLVDSDKGEEKTVFCFKDFLTAASHRDTYPHLGR
jgi:hypothetical protein